MSGGCQIPGSPNQRVSGVGFGVDFGLGIEVGKTCATGLGRFGMGRWGRSIGNEPRYQPIATAIPINANAATGINANHCLTSVMSLPHFPVSSSISATSCHISLSHSLNPDLSRNAQQQEQGTGGVTAVEGGGKES